MQDMLFAIAMIIGGARLDLPPAEIQQRFAQECVDRKWGADCPVLRTEIEVDLYGELRTLALARAPIEREVLLAASRGQFPPLAELGLRRLEKIQSPEELDVVAAALDHASPAIRELARQLLDAHSDPLRKSIARWWAIPGRSGWDALVPDPVPTAAQLGLPTVEKLRYRPFASGPGRAVFTSNLPPEGVLALIARGKKSFSGQEVAAAPKQQEAVAASMKDVEKQMREAMAKGDFKKMEEISRTVTKSMEGIATSEVHSFRAVPEFAADPEARYVRLDDGKGRPIQAVVGRDAALGATVLLIRY